MNVESYLSDLAASLQMRGADSARTSEAVAEVESHLAESGEDPMEAFGPPEEYAEQLLLREERRAGEAADARWSERTFRATAFDEMRVLEEAGRQGWELTDVGAYALHCRRPRDPEAAHRWEYSRRVGVDRQAILDDMTTLGWEPCGSWLPFHYFKRSLSGPATKPGSLSGYTS